MGIVIDASVLKAWRAYKQAEHRTRRKPRIDYTRGHAARDFYWECDELLDSARSPDAVFVQLTGKDVGPYFLEL